MRTTPAPAVDITTIVPELAAWRRTTVRLHPRPGRPRPADSHIGGPLLAVAEAVRPTCAEHPMEHDGQLVPRPMESVAQFFRRDVPEIPYPAECDLLQVHWCPNDHCIEYPDSEYGGPAVSLAWLDSTGAADESADNPFSRVEPYEESYTVRPCRLSRSGSSSSPTRKSSPASS